MSPSRVTAALATVTTIAGLSLTSGCSDDESTTNSGPGHAASGHEMVADPPESADWNAADAEFMSMMALHHRQAIEMSELAVTRSSDAQVSALASAIGTSQGLEILTFADWLTDHDLPEPQLEDMQDMEMMSSMAGMLDEEQMAALADADGAAFDALFLEGMIQHHQGAVDMASVVLADGENQRVNEIASDTSAGQQAEIGRMRDIQR